MSSTTQQIGPCRSVIVSSQRRTAQKSSSTLNGSCDRPRIDAKRSTTAGSTTRLASLSRPTSGPSSGLIPAASRTASITGQNVVPSPYERHRPLTTVASSATEATTSRMSRDLPTPASPMTVAIVGFRSSTAVRNWARRKASSSVRPTSGWRPSRAAPSMPAATSSRRYAATRSALPLSSSGSIGSIFTASRTRRHVSSPISTSFGPAACSRRAAVFTVSPVTRRWAVAASPVTTSPVLTPVRFVSRTPKSRSSSSLSAARAACVSYAARTARSASSSWIRGSPKTAMMASPMNFSIVPPCRRSASVMASK